MIIQFTMLIISFTDISSPFYFYRSNMVERDTTSFGLFVLRIRIYAHAHKSTCAQR